MTDNSQTACARSYNPAQSLIPSTAATDLAIMAMEGFQQTEAVFQALLNTLPDHSNEKKLSALGLRQSQDFHNLMDCERETYALEDAGMTAALDPRLERDRADEEKGRVSNAHPVGQPFEPPASPYNYVNTMIAADVAITGTPRDLLDSVNGLVACARDLVTDCTLDLDSNSEARQFDASHIQCFWSAVLQLELAQQALSSLWEPVRELSRKGGEA